LYSIEDFVMSPFVFYRRSHTICILLKSFWCRHLYYIEEVTP